MSVDCHFFPFGARFMAWSNPFLLCLQFVLGIFRILLEDFRGGGTSVQEEKSVQGTPSATYQAWGPLHSAAFKRLAKRQKICFKYKSISQVSKTKLGGQLVCSPWICIVTSFIFIQKINMPFRVLTVVSAV